MCETHGSSGSLSRWFSSKSYFLGWDSHIGTPPPLSLLIPLSGLPLTPSEPSEPDMEDQSGMNRTKKKTLESIHYWEAARGLAAWGGSSQILIETRIRRKNLGCSYRRLSPHRTQHNFYYSRRATNSNGWRDLEAILSAFLAQIDKHHLPTQTQPCLCQWGLSFFLFFLGCSEPPPLPMFQSPPRTLFLDSNRAYHDQAFFYWSTIILSHHGRWI